MPNYSKAPRGLFVHVELGRVFTSIAISPSESSRQLLARDAIRAGRNLPDKELRYRRTVIVTAAVYWSLTSEQLSYDNHPSA